MLAALQGPLTLGFVVGSLLAMGMSLSVRRIVDPVRDPRVAAGAVVAGFVVVPVVALALGAAMTLDEDVRIGLLLMACAHGGPFLPRLAAIARGDLALAVGLMGLQVVVTMVSLPVVVPLLLPGASVDPRAIAGPLVVQIGAPLAVGLAVAAGWPAVAARLRRPLLRFSNACFVLLLGVLVALNAPTVVELAGTGAMLAAVLLCAAGAGAGYLLGGRTRGTRTVVSVASAMPGMSAAFVVGVGSFPDRAAIPVFLAAATVVLLLVLVPFSFLLGRRQASGAPGAAAFTASRDLAS